MTRKIDRSFHFESASKGDFDHGLGNLKQKKDALKASVDRRKLKGELEGNTPNKEGRNQEGNRDNINTRERNNHPSRNKEKTRNIRETLDIFGDKETMKHYMDGIREALETPGMGDKLHDYITANERYKRSSFHTLNSQWQEMLGFTPDEKYLGKNNRETNKRIAAASQLLMIEYYQTHVFESEKTLDLNPWRFADGKTGAYTVSVYAEYWDYRHGALSKREKPNRAVLGEGYEDSNTFDTASRELDAAIESSTTQKSESQLPGVNEVGPNKEDPGVTLAKNLR